MVLERAGRCQMCGTAEWEWDADQFAYAPVYHTCHGCRIKELMNEDDTPRSKGTTIRLVPKQVAARLSREAPLKQRPRRRKRR